ncbi:MAG: dihydrodipicolinate synthase family protein [Candidatus Aenigmatarchaeota archaeon]
MVEKCEGAMTALIRPDNFKDFIKLVEYQVAYGIHGLVPCGTTGQSPTLDWEEHKGYISETIKIANGKVPVIAGAGSNNPDEGVDATKHAADMGAYATLHVTGYYNCPSQQGFADYFSKVAEAAPECKVIIYNIPGRGHPIIKPDIMIALAMEYPNIIGNKDSTGGKAKPTDDETSFWKAIRAEARKNGLNKHAFKLISGDDPNTYRMMSDPEIEGVGAISVWANMFPRVYAKLAELALDGRHSEAKKIDDSLIGLNKIVGIPIPEYYASIGKRKLLVKDDTFRNPEAVNFAAYLLGMTESPRMRSPMGFLPYKDGQERIGKTLADLYEKHPEYFSSIEEFFKPKPSIGDRLMHYRA